MRDQEEIILASQVNPKGWLTSHPFFVFTLAVCGSAEAADPGCPATVGGLEFDIAYTIGNP
jgi:hypothetical protein